MSKMIKNMMPIFIHDCKNIIKLAEIIHDDEDGMDMEDYAEDIENFVSATEKLAVKSRNLPLMSGYRYAYEMTNEIYNREINIQVEITSEGWVRVIIPNVRPKSHMSAKFIRQPLQRALKNFFFDYLEKNKHRFVIEYSIVIIKIYYPNDLEEKLCSDVDNLDNYEISGIVDDIAKYFLPGDGPFRCGRCVLGDRAESPHLEVYAIPYTDFSAWVEKHNPDAEKNSNML